MSMPADADARKMLFLEALTEGESNRLLLYKDKAPHEVFDLNQNPVYRALHSKNGVLQTLISSMGILWIDEENRFMALRELLLSMGYPCTQDTDEAFDSNEPMNSFSRNVPMQKQRAHKAMCSQTGNAMHVNAMGMFEMTALLFLPIGSSVSAFDVAHSKRRKRRRLNSKPSLE